MKISKGFGYFRSISLVKTTKAVLSKIIAYGTAPFFHPIVNALHRRRFFECAGYIVRNGTRGDYMRWLWYFIIYSFAGFLLEVAFACAIRHPKRDRKCLLLLPLCPVYGLGASLILWLAPIGSGPLWVALAGGFAATGAELAMGLFYRFALGVEFWDYSGIPGSLDGLVCPAFSACWTVLSLLLVYTVHPLVTAAVSLIPAWLGPPALILLGADLLVSCAALRRTGTTDVLRWYAPNQGSAD